LPWQPLSYANAIIDDVCGFFKLRLFPLTSISLLLLYGGILYGVRSTDIYTVQQ